MGGSCTGNDPYLSDYGLASHPHMDRGLGMPEAGERRREVVLMWNADVDPQRLDRRMIRRLLLFWFLGACFV